MAEKQSGIRTLGRLAPSTVFENCVSVFNSSHGRQILKEIWHISVMVCHALSALSEKTSSRPRHSKALRGESKPLGIGRQCSNPSLRHGPLIV